MVLKRAQLATVVPRGDAQDGARTAGACGTDTGRHGLPNRLVREPVDHDLKHRRDLRGESTRDRALHGRAIGETAGGHEAPVYRSEFCSWTTHAARQGDRDG